jgi:hypothetical protein
LWSWVRVIVFNATFSNISVIWWRSVVLVEETGVHRPAASHWQTWSHNVASSTPHHVRVWHCIIIRRKFKRSQLTFNQYQLTVNQYQLLATTNRWTQKRPWHIPMEIQTGKCGGVKTVNGGSQSFPFLYDRKKNMLSPVCRQNDFYAITQVVVDRSFYHYDPWHWIQVFYKNEELITLWAHGFINEV